MERRLGTVNGQTGRENLWIECAMSGLEKFQVHNPQLKMGMPRETEHRGINENFINLKMSL